ncbi:hypothetical protein [Natrinema ejinorense]|uniref:Uncharacterized protein n=1 Tax=Natrinema ejinorense TaxID=373386 RepID=A0A2A5QPI9_9EURY|nr:hypothetical protein [Natrinema ejinorense]PCR88653.1 hypothetical protein CP557_21720 [Natrinema ejinorense]
MSTETIDGPTLGSALENLFAVVDGDAEIDTTEYDRAMEPGLTDAQREVAAEYAGAGRVEVESSTVPNLGQKLAAGKKLPWTFTLDGVRFVMKTSTGMGSSVADSEWRWGDGDYWFTFYRHTDDRTDEVSIREA